MPRFKAPGSKTFLVSPLLFFWCAQQHIWLLIVEVVWNTALLRFPPPLALAHTLRNLLSSLPTSSRHHGVQSANIASAFPLRQDE